MQQDSIATMRLNNIMCVADMKKGADTQIFSAEIFESFGNFWSIEDYLLLL